MEVKRKKRRVFYGRRDKRNVNKQKDNRKSFFDEEGKEVLSTRKIKKEKRKSYLSKSREVVFSLSLLLRGVDILRLWYEAEEKVT